MLNMETKRFKLKSQNGIISIRNKQTNAFKVISSNDVPSDHFLSQSSESAFDDAMEELMG